MDEDSSRLSPIPEFVPCWNSATIMREHGVPREIDRRSWINVDNQPLRYVLDTLGLPQSVFHTLVYSLIYGLLDFSKKKGFVRFLLVEYKL